MGRSIESSLGQAHCHRGLYETFEIFRNVVSLFVQNDAENIDARRFELFADLSNHLGFRSFGFHDQDDPVHFIREKSTNRNSLSRGNHRK